MFDFLSFVSMSWILHLLKWLLLLGSPYLCYTALHEYYQVGWQEQAPAYPLGKTALLKESFSEAQYKKDYLQFMLYVGIGSALVWLLLLLALFIKNLLRLALLAALLYMAWLISKGFI